MSFPWQFPYFFHNRRVSSFCESHFFSPFWWRSFRRFCPLVICTETASRFERGPKHVAQRWGIEADGFVGNANKTSKPHTEMCKTTHLFQSVLLHKCFFFFVACFCGCKKKIPTWNAISQEQEYQKKMFWSRILLRHTFPFQRIPPQIRRVDLVEWYLKLVMKNIAMKDFTLGVLPWKLTCLQIYQWLEDVFPTEIVPW